MRAALALQALYRSAGEPSLIPGIRPINPLDVLDPHSSVPQDNAFMIHTWTVVSPLAGRFHPLPILRMWGRGGGR